GLGRAFITGYAGANDFPTLDPLQSTFAGFADAFVAGINSAGDALVYSTYLGGSSEDYGNAIAVEGAGNTYAAGVTSSGSDFPKVNPLQQNLGGSEGFIAIINEPTLAVPTPAATPNPSVPPAILGMHRLKGIRGKKFAYQISTSGVVTKFTFQGVLPDGVKFN